MTDDNQADATKLHPDQERAERALAMTAAGNPEPILQFFEFAHLPPHLAAISGRFYDMAQTVVALLPRNPERTVALRKLLEAKDAAVRARLYK